MAEQRVEFVSAIAVAYSTSAPSNTEVLWVDLSIQGDNVYEKLKCYINGNWTLINRNASQILKDLKTVDGIGSGLDADTLQGLTPDQLIQQSGGVPSLSSGELLVGQADSIGVAKTISGIATIDTNGVLTLVPGSISHTELTDIGVNTHAQIDSHISDTSNPHNVTAAQVGNDIAQWNAGKINGNVTNVGAPGAGQDGYAIVWDAGVGEFVLQAASADSIYTTSGTVPSSVVATITDTLTFLGGNLIKKGSNTSGLTSSFKLIDSGSNSLWDWRNNGDVHLGRDTKFDLGSNEITIEGASGSLSSVFDGQTWRIYAPSNSGFSQIALISATSTSGAPALTHYGSTYSVSQLQNKTVLNSRLSGNGMHYMSYQDHSFQYGTGSASADFSNSSRRLWISNTLTSVHNCDFVFSPSDDNPALIGTEDFSIQGRTLVKGADTLSTSTAFEIYDGDTVPGQLLSIRNNGKFILDSSKGYDATPFLVQGYPYGGTGTKPYLKVKGYGEVEILGRLTELFTVKNSLGNTILDVNDGAVNINGTTAITSSYFQVKTTSSAMDFYTSSGGSLVHSIQTFGFPNNVRFNILGGTRQFIVGGSAIIGSETISLQGSTLINGTLDMNNNRITKTIVNPTVQETTSTATLTINANQENTGVLTAQAVALTVANPTGTAVQGQKLVYRIKDNGTGRAITWGANFRAIGVTLPTTTTASKLLYVGCIYNTTDSKWDVIAVNEEA